MTDRQGVEIDYCPQCRGVWLDRNELNILIEKANASSHDSYREERKEEYRPRQEEYHHDRDERGSYGGHHKKKKGGFLGDLFEFGD